jgi:hypothetical protein
MTSFGLPLLWGMLLGSLAAAQQPDPPELIWEDNSLGNYYQYGAQVAWIGDVDGDATDDFAVSSPGVKKVEVFSGSTKSEIARVNGGVRFGHSLASIGDVNGDGIPDFAAGTPYTNSNAGEVKVISGADFSELYVLNGNYASHYFGWGIVSIDDTDGDGVPDFLVHSKDQNGIVSLHSGATGALRFEIFAQAQWEDFGEDLTGIHDFNNDGAADFLVGAPGGFSGGLAILFSGADGATLSTLQNAGSEGFGASIAMIGDINADAIPDFVIGAPTTPRFGSIGVGEARIYNGSNLAELRYHSGNSARQGFGQLVAAAGDYDQDGIPDYLIASPDGDPNGIANAGKVELFSGANAAVLGRIAGTQSFENLPSSMAGIGDGHRDLYPDFLIGSSNYGSSEGGRVQIWGLPSPWLQVHNLVAGSTATLSAHPCQPGGTVQFWMSRFGDGPSSTIFGPVLLDRPFFFIGSSAVPITGLAELDVFIPLPLAAATLHCQGLELRPDGRKRLTTGITLLVQ